MARSVGGMGKLLILLFVLASCHREPARSTTPAAAPPPDPAAADAAYEAKDFTRCAELYAALAERGDVAKVDHFYNAACCHALAGDRDQAFAMIDRAIAAGLHDLYMGSDQDFVSLHGDPRWQAAWQKAQAAHDAVEKAIQEPALRDELLALVEEDQAARNAWIDAGSTDPAVLERVRASDRKTTARMKEVIAKHGWPGKSLVGEEGAHAAWLLVQHADADRAFQKQCLALIEKAAQAGEARKTEYAYLYDRVAVAEKRPQRYGTQYDNGKPFPIEDAAHVDERRRAIGLGTMAEYDKRMREIYGKDLGTNKK